ncbi:unnamed protein product [Blepharisma stoltei]|uniref:C2H2-type domain-containing protein n=1 Tax=Blepharisma stoltei TaxID=1481888 RepID=A0AAU9JIR5_9CILI|nr:unnamed protein product [Blepharisma stoltei]
MKLSTSEDPSEVFELKNQVHKHKKLVAKLKQQLEAKAQTLATYEYLLKQPSTSVYMHRSMLDNKAAKCPYCSKCFMGTDFLEKHLSRRHPSNAPPHKEQERPQTEPIPKINNLDQILESMQNIVTTQASILKQSFDKQATELQGIFERHIQDSSRNRSFNETEYYTQTPLSFQQSISTIKLEKLSQLQEQNESILKEQESELQVLKAENMALRNEYATLHLHLSQSGKLSPSSMHNKYKGKEVIKPKLSRYRSESGEEQDTDLLWNNFEHEIRLDGDRSPYRNKIERLEEVSFTRKGPALGSELHSDNFTYSGELTFSDIPESDESSPDQYLHPISDPTTKDIIKAAKVLRMDPKKDAQYLNVAVEFLKNPLQKPWTYFEDNGIIRFRNLETGEVTEKHPGIEWFIDLYTKLKAKKLNTIAKARSLMQNKRNYILQEKYNSGIQVFFKHEKAAFQAKRAKTDQLIDDYMKKIKQTHSLIMKIEEEREKKIASGSIYVRANDLINAEVLALVNSYKLRNA